jgi:hypothetical protein
MTDKMLLSLSIFLTGIGAGVALASLVVPRSRKSGKGSLQAKARVSAH